MSVLPNSTKIYRYVNFFDAYAILSNNQLSFTRQSLMNDKNEGVGHYLARLQRKHYPARSEEAIKNYFKQKKETTYLSCWTKVRESIAMWQMYSTDFFGVRVTTTAGKIKAAMKQFFRNQKTLPRLIAEFGAKQPNLVKMAYLDLREQLDRINRTNEEIEFQIERSRSIARLSSRELFRIIRENLPKSYLDPPSLKDKAYDYEKEIRAVIEFGPLTEDAADMLDQMPELISFPDSVPLPVDPGLIEELCFDPRCPDFRLDVMKEIVQPFAVPITSTNVFGSILTEA